MSPLLLLAALAVPQAGGRGGGVTLDEATLVIRVDTQEVARESFRLLTRRAEGPDTIGWMLVTRTRWESSPPVTFSPVIELTPDSTPGALAYEVADGTTMRITGHPGPGRYTLRYVAPGLERARELALLNPTVIVDDSVFAPYLLVTWRATATPRIVHAIYPRSASRAALTITDFGLDTTTLNRDPATLRHVLIAGGAGGPVHVWLAADGRLMKLEIPRRTLRAERLPG